MPGEKKKCIHVITRGSNDGKVCGRNSCKKSITGNYCTFHLSQENRGKQYKYKQTGENIVKHKIKKDPNYGRYIHEETGLVFFSPSRLVVYSRQIENKLYPLSREDIQKCIKYRFRYNKTLFQTEEDSDSD